MAPSQRNEQVLAAILESAEDAIVGLTPDGSIELWSRGAQLLYGYTADEVRGQSAMALLPIYEVPAFRSALRAAQRGAGTECETVERLHKFGFKVSVAVRRVALLDEQGMVTGICEIGRAVGHITRDQLSDAQLRMVADQMPVLLWTTDRQLRITSNWGSEWEHSGIRARNLKGRTISEFLACRKADRTPMAHHYSALRGESVKFEYKRQDRVLDIHLEPLRAASGEIIGCIGVAVDITQRKRTEQEIRYQATHDALTGAANYREFVDTLERELRRAERSHQSFTVLLLDLDDLKRINDRYGHLAGNKALIRLARVIRQQCRGTDLVARYGGDEFAVVLIDSDQEMAQQVALRIETSVRENQEEPPITVSLGTAVYPIDGRTAQELLEAADRQLYRQKRKEQSRNVTVG